MMHIVDFISFILTVIASVCIIGIVVIFAGFFFGIGQNLANLLF